MVPKRAYDCIVIGGGHNGLVTAAYLAKAGKSVCVLERRAVLGGCAASESLWPGYRVSTAAYVISLLLPEIIRDLRLRQYGFRILPRDPSSFTPLLDGRSLLMGPNEQATRAEIAKFSERDAQRYPAYTTMLERVAERLEPVLSRAAPDPLPLSKEYRQLGVVKRLGDARRMWDLYQAAGELGDDLPEAIELLTGAARPILERWFEAEVLRATLATDAIIGAFASISSPGTAYVLLHHVMGTAGGARGIWGYVQGGMGGLADALESACRDLRVDVVREAEVTSGGSLYWVIKGVILARQRILRFDPVDRGDGITRCGLVLDPGVIRTEATPKRPFQGWRYLAPADAPRDLPKDRRSAETLPPRLEAALAEIGVR